MYFERQFPFDLKSIDFQYPNSALQNFLNEPVTPFFGGDGWKNCKSDLGSVRVENRHLFVLAVFMIVLTDQCLYARHKDVYTAWRAKTNFPKFGWTGFGIHNDNPFKLLWAPERDSVIDTAALISTTHQFVQYFISMARNYFSELSSDFDSNAFFLNIKNDSAYQFDEGNVVKKFKVEFEKMIPNELSNQ